MPCLCFPLCSREADDTLHSPRQINRLCGLGFSRCCRNISGPINVQRNGRNTFALPVTIFSQVEIGSPVPLLRRLWENTLKP